MRAAAPFFSQVKSFRSLADFSKAYTSSKDNSWSQRTKFHVGFFIFGFDVGESFSYSHTETFQSIYEAMQAEDSVLFSVASEIQVAEFVMKDEDLLLDSFFERRAQELPTDLNLKSRFYSGFYFRFYINPLNFCIVLHKFFRLFRPVRSIRRVLCPFRCSGREIRTLLCHKVAIRPGKPILFAKPAQGPLLFGLPGNPVAAAVGYRFFVATALRAMLGQQPEQPITARSRHAFAKRGGLKFFGKAWAETDADGQLWVRLLPGQESFKIHPLLDANCWAIVPEDCEEVGVGQAIRIAALNPFAGFPAAPGASGT